METAPTLCMRDWLDRWLMCLCAQNTTSGREDLGRTNVYVFVTWGVPRA